MTTRLVAAFRGPYAPVRKATYLTSLALLAAYLAVALLARGDRLALLRSFSYAVIALADLVASAAIRPTFLYHPAYKVEKWLSGVGFAGLAASTATGTAAPELIALLWLACLVVAKMAAFEFIVHVNHQRDRKLIKTTFGLVPTPPEDVLIQMVQIVAGAARHDDIPQPWREILNADTGHPTRSDIAEDLRRQIAARRERAARQQAITDEVSVESLRDGQG